MANATQTSIQSTPIDGAHMRVTAIVVTFNRKDLLVEVLEALLNQTRRPDRILIVDNASTDGTTEALLPYFENLYIEYVRLNRNTGGAGGFHEGIKRSVEGGADWVWCMDDDCVPLADTLERLIEPLRDQKISNAGWLASRVMWTDGTPCLMNLPVAHPLWIEPHQHNPRLSRLLGTSLVSMLVSSDAVRQFGLPVKQFFIWFDDAEFSRRISAQLPCYLVSDSVVVHKTPSNMAPLDINSISANSLWKFRYGVRNECSFHLHTGGMIAALQFGVRISGRLARARKPLKINASILAAWLQGLFFNYPTLIEFPSTNLSSESKSNVG
jgi:GT2 family glycosyltransferase